MGEVAGCGGAGGVVAGAGGEPACPLGDAVAVARRPAVETRVQSSREWATDGRVVGPHLCVALAPPYLAHHASARPGKLGDATHADHSDRHYPQGERSLLFGDMSDSSTADRGVVLL